MIELSRLLESSDDELERALLGSVLAESPSEAGLRDAALALGLTATTASALVATLPAVAASAAASPSAAAPLAISGVAAPGVVATAAPGVAATAGAASLLTLGKGLVGGALVSFFALTTVDRTMSTEGSAPTVAVVTTSRTPTAPPAPQVERPVAVAEEVAPTPPPETAGVEPSSPRSVSPLPRLATVAAEAGAAPGRAAFDAAPATSAPKTITRSAASLAAETRLLTSARAALSRGETGAAAQLLQQYEAAEPSGILAREAALLRVRLLLATGQRAAASEQARHIISLYPRDAHADSLRRLAAER